MVRAFSSQYARVLPKAGGGEHDTAMVIGTLGAAPAIGLTVDEACDSEACDDKACDSEACEIARSAEKEEGRKKGKKEGK